MDKAEEESKSMAGTEMTPLVVPGTRLGDAGEATAGAGVYERDGGLFAAVVGRVKRSAESGSVSVAGAGAARPTVVPVVNSTVTCRVTKVNPRFAMCEILCVGPKSVPGHGFKGLIRKENVRSFEVDRVEMHESFRPGDIVRAVVASLGSARSYELSTAETSLGVVSALGEDGQPLVAVSFDQMRCPATGAVEKRKVARLDVGAPPPSDGADGADGAAAGESGA